MPQITLLLSQNIDLERLYLNEFFQLVHEVLREVPKMDVNTIHSGVLQERHSYIGLSHQTATKVYLQLYWMESAERSAMKSHFGQRLMTVLQEHLVPQIKAQGLLCIPRVRIANLGELGHDYFIGVS